MDTLLSVSKCGLSGGRMAGSMKRAMESRGHSRTAVRGAREAPSIHAYGRGGISIQRHLTELKTKFETKETFKIGIAILTSLMRDRYSSASRSEQTQLYSTASKVATLLTTLYTGAEFWRVGLDLFRVASSVITQLDELMHMRACTGLAQKFLGEDPQRKKLPPAAATVSGPSVVRNLPAEPLQQVRSALSALVLDERKKAKEERIPLCVDLPQRKKANDREEKRSDLCVDLTFKKAEVRGEEQSAATDLISKRKKAGDRGEGRIALSDLPERKKDEARGEEQSALTDLIPKRKKAGDPGEKRIALSDLPEKDEARGKEQGALTDLISKRKKAGEERIALPDLAPERMKAEDRGQERSALTDLVPERMKAEENREELSNTLSKSSSGRMEAEDRRDEAQPVPEEVPETEFGFPEFPLLEDPDIRLARALTMEELGMEIQAILQRVNRTFAGRSRAFADEFLGLQEAIQATLQEITNGPRGPPPAAKEEVEKLSIVAVTRSVLARIGDGTQCAVCREVLVVGDIMQEMPCKHPYHPQCLKPWLDKHNSCPICRFELRTDDEDYERQKHLDHEAEDQRRWVQLALKEEELLNM